jgi:hypothetical protein
MGAFLLPGKNGCYWTLLSYLQDGNTYISDNSLIPYTPNKLQTYTSFFPELWVDGITTTLSFWINGTLRGHANIFDATGMVYLDVIVPEGPFTLEIKNAKNEIISTEVFNAKNYAMFLDVAAQSYDERRNAIELLKADQNFQEMRSERLWNNIGCFFEFPPPPGWPADKYRAVLLGGCGPGFIKSFFYGGTLKGIVDTIKSITCQDPVVGEAQGGIRWFVRDDAHTDPANPGAEGFFITSDANLAATFTPPQYRAVMASEDYWDNAASISVIGATRTITDEEFIKSSDSFIECKVPEPYNLDGLTLQFSIEEVGVDNTLVTYSTSFPMPTRTAQDAANAILAANPTLTGAIHGSTEGFLRIGVQPEAGKVFRVTILGGSALVALGWGAGDSAEISPDSLANPWVTGNVAVLEGTTSFVQGVDYVVDAARGQIIWFASTSSNIGVPASGTSMTASYIYQMRREIEKAVSLVKRATDIIEFTWS